jgi:hypothetical protein
LLARLAATQIAELKDWHEFGSFQLTVKREIERLRTGVPAKCLFWPVLQHHNWARDWPTLAILASEISTRISTQNQSWCPFWRILTTFDGPSKTPVSY